MIESPEFLRRYGHSTDWILQGLTPEGAWRTYGGVFLADVPNNFDHYLSRYRANYPHILSWRILDTLANTVLALTERV